MQMIQVSSSNINSIGYDKNLEVLRIEFHEGNLYEYYNVPNSIYNGLMSATSKGSYFHENIKNKYGDKKII